MAIEEVEAAGANLPNPDLNGPQVAASTNFQDKYAEERTKRLRTEGYNQYIDLRQSDRYARFIEDPWIPTGHQINNPIPNNGHVQTIILGAGWGGILSAVKLRQAGFDADKLLIVDPAGGFGGTWWWNRYPGLMCDVESYMYLPLLEEMEYMPKRRYASGHEIREYAEMVASKYGLHERGMFQSSAEEVRWDEGSKEWTVRIAQKPKGGSHSTVTVRADFVIFATGVLNSPKLADLPGMGTFQGHEFHTARWDYAYTGGDPKNPELTGLKGKKVALVGTGATAVQATPELAKYAEKLYIVQRTPSSVDRRDNHDTDGSTWRKQVATGKGWWRERNVNFAGFIQNASPRPSTNLVDDAWTRMPSYSALIGTQKPVTMENMMEHIGELHELDYPRQEGNRQRVSKIVQNQETAERLKAWYPGWCKRPCFHDEYLQSFNLPNVRLIDTDGKGLDRVTEKGLVANGEEYEVDVIIWSTGFRSPFIGSPAGKGDIRVKGRDGIDIETVAEAGDFHTLHGACARRFPNMFYLGPVQTGVSANFTFILDAMATHVAYIMSTALAKTASAQTVNGTQTNGASTPTKTVIEPTAEAQEAWAMQILSGALALAGMGGCTPSYLNKEGESDKLTQEQQMKVAAGGIWAKGLPSWLEAVEGWRADGKMEGLEVASVA